MASVEGGTCAVAVSVTEETGMRECAALLCAILAV